MIRGPQKQCSKVSGIQIHKYKYTNTVWVKFEDRPMERPKEDPDDVGEQGDDVGRRTDLADRNIHRGCKSLHYTYVCTLGCFRNAL